MSEVSLIRTAQSARQSLEDGYGRVFVFDAVTQDETSRSAKATSHQVEGSDFSDHIQVQQPQKSVTGVLVNTPIVDVDSAEPDRMVTAYQVLVGMMTRRELVTYVDGVEVLENMALVEVTRSTKSLNELSVSIRLTQLTVTSPEFVQVPPEIVEAIEADAAADEERRNDDETTTEEEEARARSWALQMTDSIGLTS